MHAPRTLTQPDASAETKCVIYGLFDPRDGALRYIGKTTVGIVLRLERHIATSRATTSRGYNAHVARWIRILDAAGLKPMARVMEVCPCPSDLGALEQHWIRISVESGASLTNMTAGGDGGMLGYRHSTETIEKLRRRPPYWKGRRHSAETRDVMSTAATNREASRSICEKTAISAKHRERWADPSFRRKHRQSLKASEAFVVAARRIALANSVSRRIRVVDQHGAVYESMCAAAKAAGASVGHVRNVIIGRTSHAKGFVFSRYSESEVQR